MTCLSLGEIPEQIVHCTGCGKPILQSEACLGQPEARFICAALPLGGMKNNNLSSSRFSTGLGLTHEPGTGAGPVQLRLGLVWSSAAPTARGRSETGVWI